MENQAPITLDPAFPKEVQGLAKLNFTACYQCKKCTNGCPVTFAMDLYPDQVIRLVILGQREKVLNCDTIWICASCATCTTRCPNEVDIAATMDTLKEMAIKEGVKIPQPRTYAFHKAFLDDIKRRGRVFEGRMMFDYMLKSGELWRKLKNLSIWEDVSLGRNMRKKGRMPVFPKGIKAKKEIKEILSPKT